MVKNKAKAKTKLDSHVKEKPWPIVTSDVCTRCPIQCPTGIHYMQQMQSGGRPGRGVVCKKELFLHRKAQGLDPFRDTPKLAHSSFAEDTCP